MLKSFLSLVYPDVCAVCGCSLLPFERVMCLPCFINLPLTRFWLWDDNPMALSFYGRFPFERAAALFYFRPLSPYRRLLHRFKYQGRKDAGVFLSTILGRALLEAGAPWTDISHIVPVPLHPSKERKRGYNQSAVMAQTLASLMGAVCVPDLLRRVRRAKSQTTMHRWDRWLNVKNDYRFNGSCTRRPPPHSHLLLVDDVSTTGATLEACANAILSAGFCYKISVCVLAYVE